MGLGYVYTSWFEIRSLINVVDYVFLTGSLALLFENSTRFALTFSDSLTSLFFERTDTASGDNCNAAFLAALDFAVLAKRKSEKMLPAIFYNFAEKVKEKEIKEKVKTEEVKEEKEVAKNETGIEAKGNQEEPHSNLPPGWTVSQTKVLPLFILQRIIISTRLPDQMVKCSQAGGMLLHL